MPKTAPVQIATLAVLALLLSGGSMAGIALIPLMKKLGEDLATDVLGDLYSDTVESFVGDSRKKSHLQSVIRNTMAECIRKAAGTFKEPWGKPYLQQLAKAVENSREDFATPGVSGRVDGKSITRLLSLKPGETLHRSPLTVNEWVKFLEKFESGSRPNALKHAATELNQHFTEELVKTFKDAGAENDRAWFELVMEFLGEIHGAVEGLPERLQGVEFQVGQLKSSIETWIAQMSDDNRRFFEQTWNLLASNSDVLKSIAGSLHKILNRPWEHEVLDIPFLHTREETKLVGAATGFLDVDIPRFLEDKQTLRWWLWTGLEGAGKSRLAMEACRRAIANDWDAGIISDETLRSFGHWDTCDVNKNTLMVLDYVGLNPHGVRSLLLTLSRRVSGEKLPKLRILLLERHIGPIRPDERKAALPQWYSELFSREALHQDDTGVILENQYSLAADKSSFHLGSLDRSDALAVAEEYLRTVPVPEGQDERLYPAIAVQAVDLLQSDLRPLLIMVTARVLVNYQSTRFSDFSAIMTKWFEHRIPLRRELLRHLFGAAAAERYFNLLCVATVLGQAPAELPPGNLLPSPEELRDTRYFECFGQAAEGTLKKLEPDLIGEWFVFYRTQFEVPNPGLETAALADIVSKCPNSTLAIRDFVRRTYRYFHNQPLWRVLSASLGRYATAFGELFDSKLALLTGGETAKAEEYYDKKVFEFVQKAVVENNGTADVIDLMAGGPARPQRLLNHFRTRIRLLAVDQDDSRLVKVNVGPLQKFHIHRLLIAGKMGLKSILEKHFNVPQCDVVIAKKALHEVDWPQQQEIIAELGELVRPGGAVVLYADSPVRMDEQGSRKWRVLQQTLRDSLPVDKDVDPQIMPEVLKQLLPSGRTLSDDDPTDAAVFANLWAKLKDWANYNVREWDQRYFSSCNELEHEFDLAGFDLSEKSPSFNMQLQATRFVEDAINRLGFLASIKEIEPEDFKQVLSENTRYEFFWKVVETTLWENGRPTRFGSNPYVSASAPGPFELDEFVQDVIAPGRALDFPSMEGPSFHMPCHIFVFRKRTLS